LSIIRKQLQNTKAPDWPQLRETDGLLPEVKIAFANLQKEILVAIAVAPVKQASIYLKLAYLLINTEDDFGELLKMCEAVRKKPLPEATEQEHKINIHLHYNTKKARDNECLSHILHPAPKWEQP